VGHPLLVVWSGKNSFGLHPGPYIKDFPAQEHL